MGKEKSLHEWEQKDDDEIKRQIVAEMGSYAIDIAGSTVQLFVSMLQGILSRRGQSQVGRNDCTGGSKTRVRKER